MPAPDRPGQLWQSDITYLETQQGWLYLAFTLDACSRRCIAHHCRQDMVAELTTTTPGNHAGDPAVLGHHFRADHSESVYMGIVAAMGFELSYDMFRTAELSEELRENERRVDLAASAAELGLWVWDIARDEMWTTDKSCPWTTRASCAC